MKRKYCLIREPHDLDVGSFVYVVWAGSSLRESERLALVEEFCKDCGWYFKQWSPLVDSAITMRTKFVRLDGCLTATPFRMISMSIEECYQTIIDDNWKFIEAHAIPTPQEIRMRFGRTTEYLSSYHHCKCITKCHPSGRNNLSLRNCSDGAGVALVSCGIVLIFVLDAIVSHFLLMF